ncbi:MAG: hypothetical protein PHE41_04575, partial [Eubacteriales bacterium]|nr:hypothetical protein [Eubacteriales bacterium]
MKRMISFMMVLCLVLTMAMPSYAGENDSKGLEEAILAVKKVVEIPDGFTEFYYHSYENDGKTGNGTVWNLSWSDESREGSIYASVDWKGNLISYEKYVRNDEKGLAKINRAQAVQIATNFLAKACPGLATNMREINRDQNSTYSYGHLIQYGYYVNGIPANFINVLLCVDKYTGEIASYEGLYPGFELPDFPLLLDAIDQDTAKTAFLKEIGISLKYHSYYNYRNKSLSVFPTYQIAKKHQVIDAITGKAVDLYYGDDRMRSSNMKEFASDANGMGAEDQNLTKEELAAIKNLEGLLTKEQAAERIKDQASVLPATLEVKGATLRQHYIEKETFIWDISFENAYGSLDAKTGELLCFSYYEAQDKGNSNLSKESAKKIGEAFLNIVAPTKFAQCVFVEEQDEYIIFNGKEEEPSNYSFKYNRKENGIEFVDNGLSVTVNRNTGKVYYYSNEWYNNLEFPSVDTVISKNEMMETMREVGDFQLVYEQVGVDGAVKPVYTFVSSIQNALFDPFNGNRIGWNGKPYKVVTKPLYTDIGGHWSESIVLELLDNGYYLKGDLFKPDQKIKQIDFFRYLFTPEMDYYTDEELYEMLKNRKIIKDGEEKPDKIITRQEIAKYMIRYLGLGLAGEHPEIFSNQFKDKVADEYKGYAALCYGLGIM